MLIGTGFGQYAHLKALKRLAGVLLDLSDTALEAAEASGELIQAMQHDDQNQAG